MLTDRVCAVVADVLGLPPGAVTADASHRTMAEWDSLRTLDIAMAIAAEFQTKLTAVNMARCVSVAGIVEILRGNDAV